MTPYILALLLQPSSPGLLVASDLLPPCNSGFSADFNRCTGYISGVHDTVRAYEAWENLREICPPARISPQELRNAFVDFVRRNPQHAGAQAASVVVLALREKYPCSRLPVTQAPER